jgi:hypothetical protein
VGDAPAATAKKVTAWAVLCIARRDEAPITVMEVCSVVLKALTAAC